MVKSMLMEIQSDMRRKAWERDAHKEELYAIRKGIQALLDYMPGISTGDSFTGTAELGLATNALLGILCRIDRLCEDYTRNNK